MKKAYALLPLPLIAVACLLYLIQPKNTSTQATTVAFGSKSTESIEVSDKSDLVKPLDLTDQEKPEQHYTEQSIKLIAQSKGIDEELLRWYFS